MLLACVFCLAGCSDTSLNGIDQTAEIKVIQYDKSSGAETAAVVLTEESDIKHIVDNLNSLGIKKMITTGPTILEYKMVFYNSNNEVIETVSVSADDWINFDGYFHSIKSGEFDRAYLAGLFLTVRQ